MVTDEIHLRRTTKLKYAMDQILEAGTRYNKCLETVSNSDQIRKVLQLASLTWNGIKRDLEAEPLP